jgi:hypothetical protein
MSEAGKETTGPACRCGHGIGHYMVSAEPAYGVGAWLAMLIGISATPSKVTYRCRRCEQSIGQTTDRAVLEGQG